jgi:hypothetical protein
MARSAIRRPDLLALAAVGCLAAVPAQAQAQAQVIAAVIDPSDEEAARDAIGTFVAALPAFPSLVGIDLTILPDADGVLGVVLVGKGAEEGTPVTCEDTGFGRIPGDYAEIRFPALSVNTHMLLDVDLNGQTAQSGLVLACENRGLPAPAFRMMGRFLVSKVSIPTAEDVLMVAQPAD